MGTILKTRPIQEPAWGPGGNSSNLWVSPALLSLDIEEGDNLVGQLTKYSFTTVELIFALGWTRLLWTRHKTAPQLPPQQQVGGQRGQKWHILRIFWPCNCLARVLSQHDETLLSGLSNQQAALAAQGAALAQQVADKTNTTTKITSHQPNALSAMVIFCVSGRDDASCLPWPAVPSERAADHDCLVGWHLGQI